MCADPRLFGLVYGTIAGPHILDALPITTPAHCRFRRSTAASSSRAQFDPAVLASKFSYGSVNFSPVEPALRSLSTLLPIVGVSDSSAYADRASTRLAMI
jgi:hypothetical protein